jgi:hypothetical protein
VLTVRFNPPPGWPRPPASWAPAEDWLPEPGWPEPPPGWSFWSTAESRSGAARHGGRLTGVSFPVATAAAQSTVSLAALFPERSRQGGDASGRSRGSAGSSGFGVSGSSGGYGAGATSYGYGTSARATWVPPAPTKAGREYYVPASLRALEPADETHPFGAGSSAGSRVLDGTAVRTDRLPRLQDAGDESSDADPGIRLSALLRIVAHPSGLRAQFRVGGVVAAALAEVMHPAILAASGDRPGPRGAREASTTGRGGRQGFRLFRRGRSEGATGGSDGTRSTSGAPGGAVATGELLRRAIAARRDDDRVAAIEVERELRSLHRQAFPPLRPPARIDAVPLSPAEKAAIHQRALDVEGADEKGLSRPETGRRRQLATERAEAVIRATDIARSVIAGRQQAIAEGAWRLLREHDPVTVISVVDEAMRLSGSDITCIDAGIHPGTGRGFVTVLLRFPPPVVVPDQGIESGPGRHTWQSRTSYDRNLAYAAGLASAVLASAKQVDSVALGADDVNVVVMRPTRNGRSVEPIYVGTLDREDVSLRHPDADPMPLVLDAAQPSGIRIFGPEREVAALERASDTDGSLAEIVEACRAALEPGARPRPAAPSGETAEPEGSAGPAG